MAATFTWQRSHGAGETITTATEVNWKNIDDNTTAYSSSPITAGNNSFEIWLAGKFSGTFNQISAGLYEHTSVAFGTGLTLKGAKAMTVDADRLAYATPSTTANANLTRDITAQTGIGSGAAVWFGATGAATSGKAASMSTNPCWTNYLTTQLITLNTAAAGDTTVTSGHVITLQYNEN